MKKRLGNLLIFIASFMCVIVLFCCGSMKTSAASATLLEGFEFNNALRELVGSKTIPSFNDTVPEYNIEKIVFLSKGSTTKVSNLPKKSVGQNVNAYYKKDTKTVYISSSASVIYLAKTSTHMFADLCALKTITWGNKVNMTRLENMHYMFERCTSLQSIDLSVFNCPNMYSMSYAFSNCTSLKTIDFSKSKIKVDLTVSDLLYKCTSLTSVNLKGIDMSKTRYTGYIFCHCESLPSVDVSYFDLSNSEYVCGMFDHCTSLKTINFGKGFYAPKATRLQYFFNGCESLEKIDMTKIKVPNNTDTFLLFQDCKSLTELDFSRWDMSKVTQCEAMVNICSSLKKLDMSNVKLKVPDYTKYKYQGDNDIIRSIPAIEEINLSGIDYSNIDGSCKDYRLRILGPNLRVVYSPINLKDDIPCKGNNDKGCVFALDDNADNVPDNANRYNSYLPASKVSHRYIVVHESGYVEPTRYDIRVYSDGNGSVSASTTYASAGTRVYLYSTPKTGYKFKEWRVIVGDVTIKNNRFTLGDSSVTIRGYFEPVATEEPVVNEPEVTVPATPQQPEKVDVTIAATRISKLKAGKGSITVKWKKQTSGIDGYEIQYSRDKNFKKGTKSITIAKPGKTSRTIKKLKSDKKYYFRIRTFKASGSCKIYSEWSKAKKLSPR